MKHAKIDNVRVLLGKNALMRVNLIQSGDRLAGLTGLPRRIALRMGRIPFFTTVNKQLYARVAVIPAEAVMVCRTFITE